MKIRVVFAKQPWDVTACAGDVAEGTPRYSLDEARKWEELSAPALRSHLVDSQVGKPQWTRRKMEATFGRGKQKPEGGGEL